MAAESASLTILRLIEERAGEWGWYQFERAFPPGWFTDEPPTRRAKDVLDRLESEGLVTTEAGAPQRKYRLTDAGQVVLRDASIGSTPA